MTTPLARSLTLVILAVSCTGQTAQPPKKPVQKPKPTPLSFVCPDPEALQACKSFEELLKAKDTGLTTRGYVCFRKNRDEFFMVWFSTPYFRKHWDKELKEMVIDTDATDPGRGSARSYKDGVEDSSVMPYLFFTGTWSPFGDSGLFSSDAVNRNKQGANDPDVGVSIDDSQFNAGYKYQNRLDKVVKYTLTIQRSTGRFSETFRVESEKLPSAEDAGRCIYRKGE